MDREILTQLLRASQGGQKVVHKMARVRKRTYHPSSPTWTRYRKILWCQCQKILDDQGQRVPVPRDECSCAARDWLQTSLLVDADALQVLEDVRDAEEQLVGVRMPLQSYMLAAFTGYLPTRQEGLEQAEAVRQTLASGQSRRARRRFDGRSAGRKMWRRRAIRRQSASMFRGEASSRFLCPRPGSIRWRFVVSLRLA